MVAQPDAVLAGVKETGALPGTLDLERVVLGVRAGVSPCRLPPVRIFLGTETGQQRAERVFIWSVEKVRDPRRIYEITLMKELPGFNPRRWLTGFTNYRFAIPELAGGQGRAIYNDVDQIYLSDPAELFDTPMGEHGFMSISDRDTSVMLIDCARMAPVWRPDAVRRERRKRLEAHARRTKGLWGPIDHGWNARDDEYQPGQSHLIHFTVLQTQPWRPFPRKFVYQHNPVAPVWDALERGADAAGFQPFNARRPSSKFRRLRAMNSAPAGPMALQADAWRGLKILSSQTGGGDCVHYTFGDKSPAGMAGLASRQAHGCHPLADLTDNGTARPTGVICSRLLEYLPDEDLPWIVDEMFARAERFVYLVIDDQDPSTLPGLSRRTRDPEWWLSLVEGAARRQPAIHWRLAIRERRAGGRSRWVHRGGGRCLGAPPVVWVLADDKAGHGIQSRALAKALGWPVEIRQLRFNLLNYLSNALLGPSLRSLDLRGSDMLEPPWPDLVISVGRRTAPVARWIGEQSAGATRLVHLGRKGGEIADDFDLVVGCAHFRQFAHPRRMETVAPLNPLDRKTLDLAARRWQGLFGDAPRPHIALIVGGASALHQLDVATARRMGEEVRGFAGSLGGSVAAVTSPRTSAAAADALEHALGPSNIVHRWNPDLSENPYIGYLAAADILVVSGESESMLSEAVATGKALLIYPLPERRPGLRARIAEAVLRRSRKPRINKRGTIRPQRGLQYLCARLIDRGWVRPRRDLTLLHRALVESGVAQMFGREASSPEGPVLHEAERVAERVRAIMGWADD